MRYEPRFASGYRLFLTFRIDNGAFECSISVGTDHSLSSLRYFPPEGGADRHRWITRDIRAG